MRGERLSSYAKQTFTSASCPSTVVEFGKGQHNPVSCLPPTTLSRIFLRGVDATSSGRMVPKACQHLSGVS